jgi:hypothetical protein
MKKIFFSLLFLSFFSFCLAQAQFVEEPSSAEIGSNPAISGIESFNKVSNLITAFLALLFIISLIGLTYGWFRYVIAGGSETTLEQGRVLLVNSLVGFVLSIVGYILLNIFKYLIF